VLRSVTRSVFSRAELILYGCSHYRSGCTIPLTKSEVHRHGKNYSSSSPSYTLPSYEERKTSMDRTSESTPENAEETKPLHLGPEKSLRGFKRIEVEIKEKPFIAEEHT